MATGVEVPTLHETGAPYVQTETGESLTAALREKIRGEVRFDEGSRALYATDGSNYRQVPIGVVVPRDEDDVIHAIHICRDFGVPVLPRGCGTSLAGQCCNVAVVLDFTKYMHRILELNPDEKYAWVQPGCINDTLRHAAEHYHLTFGPDPATHNRCTIGGNIGNNSCGVHSVMAGKTSENIDEIEIITYDGDVMRVGPADDLELEEIIRGGGPRGEIYGKLKALRDKYADEVRRRYPKIPRRVSGYNLDKLLPENGFHVAQALVGSEGTCVTVIAAKTRLVYSPPSRTLVVLGYEDVATAGDHVPEILSYKPIGLEGLDDRFIRDMKLKHLHPEDLELVPEGGGWLMVEFGGSTRQESDELANRMMDDLKRKGNPPHFKSFDDPKHEKMLWEVRESGLGATAKVPGQKENWEGWEDSAVPPDKVGPYVRDLRQLMDKYGYNCSLYGHFGDGCIHTRIDFDLKTKNGIAHYRSFISDAVDTVLKYGGSLSGEHGDGQSRAEFLPRMVGEDLVRAFGEFKTIWDPRWKMNPGKVVNPYRIDQNLRYGTNYSPPNPPTHFHFSDDHHSFAFAVERCVGVGECRRVEHGTMCPSYMATREEMHSTRGRARLLFEMLQGDPLKGGWKSDHVKEALDLCLSCKGCKGDCPVNVDMAQYKAEFLSHYYQGRLRPRTAYASGLIHWWARLASHLPGVANLLTQTTPLDAAAKWAAGYSQKRRIPPFASETFQDWFHRRDVRNEGRPRVMLWADTFTNFFQPEVAKAAVDVLEDTGYQVEVARRSLCCGRPLYDYGMLDAAKHLLLEVLREIRPQIEEEIPIIVLEPSCATVFRDEMRELIWGDEDANRLSGQVFLLSEFLDKKVKNYRAPALHRDALVHGHCHHKSVIKFTDEQKILDKTGLHYEILDSGCCGMAGAFGYEQGEHYNVSMACGERVLLPAVRNAPKVTLIIADGFSCREQIEQTTDRRALHLAQVLRLGLSEQHGHAAPERYPEDAYREQPAACPRGCSLPRACWRAPALYGWACIMAHDPERTDRIQQALREAGMDGLVCALPENVLLISGYWPVVGTSLALINRDRQTAILAPEDEKELAEYAEADSVAIFQPGSLDRVTGVVKAIREPLHQTLRNLGLDQGVVGCEAGPSFAPASYVSMQIYGAAIFGLLRDGSAGRTLARADRLLARLKAVKTEIEIDRIRRACRIAHCAFVDGAAALHPGLKETEAAALFRRPLNVIGTGFEGVERADGSVFCMSGPDGAHAFGAYARSRSRVIEVADLVLTHCNSYADGYWTDITRTCVMGEPDEQQREMYEAIFAARAVALDAIRPGIKAAEVDRAAREVMEERGFGKAFKHPAGHGVGYAAIDHNALPRLHPKSRDVLERGMVFNVEPGIYLDGYGGMRHCDVVAITQNGTEVLTDFQTSVEELIQ